MVDLKRSLVWLLGRSARRGQIGLDALRASGGVRLRAREHVVPAYMNLDTQQGVREAAMCHVVSVEPLGLNLALGMQWSGGDVPVARGQARKVARHLSEEGGGSEDAWCVIETEKGEYDQVGLGRREWGHDANCFSLGALLAARAMHAGAEGLSARARRIMDDASAQRGVVFVLRLVRTDGGRVLWYVLALRGGRVRPGSDLCTYDEDHAMEVVSEALRSFGKDAVIVGDAGLHGAGLGAVDVRACTLVDLLPGPVPGPAWLSLLGRGVNRRALVRVTGVLAVLGAVAFGAWAVYSDYAERARLRVAQVARERIEAARIAEEEEQARVRAALVDGVVQAPWELEELVVGHRVLGDCARRVEALPNSLLVSELLARAGEEAVGESFGAYRVVGVRCTGSRFSMDTVALLGSGSLGPERSVEIAEPVQGALFAPRPVARLDLAEDLRSPDLDEALELEAWRAERRADGRALFEALSEVVIRDLEELLRASALGRHVLVVRGTVEGGFQERSARLGWAVRPVLLVMGGEHWLEAASVVSHWLTGVDASVFVNEVAWERDAETRRVDARIGLVIAASAPALAETRAKEEENRRKALAAGIDQ